MAIRDRQQSERWAEEAGEQEDDPVEGPTICGALCQPETGREEARTELQEDSEVEETVPERLLLSLPCCLPRTRWGLK